MPELFDFLHTRGNGKKHLVFQIFFASIHYMFLLHVCNSYEYWSCVLVYKFTHGVDYFQCSEMFTMGKSFVNLVLHKFVITANIVIRNQI